VSEQLTANYALSEFQSVSSRPLTPEQIERARYFATELLQPLRRAMAFPIRITSFLRHRDSGAHQDASAVDCQPCRSCAGATITHDLFTSRLESMWRWLATYKTASFGTVIHERDHLHLTLPGSQGRTGVVMREPSEGKYELASLLAPVSLAPLLIFAVLFLLIGRR
jgi:hypothetical protein